jgi:toxin ParE1/3/4
VKRARFLAEARREFRAEVAYYEKLQAGLGGRFRAADEKSTSIATALPLAGSPCTSETPRVIVKGFPFSVVYRPEGVGVVVFAVAHFRRQPEFWLARR